MMSCHDMSCHDMSCHYMSCHDMSCHDMSCHVMLCYVMLFYIRLRCLAGTTLRCVLSLHVCVPFWLWNQPQQHRL